MLALFSFVPAVAKPVHELSAGPVASAKASNAVAACRVLSERAARP
jgi:hypothetical protein